MNNDEISEIKKQAIQETDKVKIQEIINKYNPIYYYSCLDLLPNGKNVTITGLFICTIIRSEDKSTITGYQRIPYSSLNTYNSELYDNEFYQLHMYDELVHPIVILTDTRPYKVNPILWRPLYNINCANIQNPIFPVNIYISEYKIENDILICDWIFELERKTHE